MADDLKISDVKPKAFTCDQDNDLTISGTGFTRRVAVRLEETRYRKDHEWIPPEQPSESNASSDSAADGTQIVVRARPRKKDGSKCDGGYPTGDLTITVTNQDSTGAATASTTASGDVNYSPPQPLGGNLPSPQAAPAPPPKPVITGISQKAFKCNADNPFTITGQNFTRKVLVRLEETRYNKDHEWVCPEQWCESDASSDQAADGRNIALSGRPRKKDGSPCGGHHPIGDLTITVTNSDSNGTTSSDPQINDVTYS